MIAKKAKETDKSYAKGVRDGFNAGISKSVEILSKDLEEYQSSQKYSLLGKAALVVFTSKVIVNLNKFLNIKE